MEFTRFTECFIKITLVRIRRSKSNEIKLKVSTEDQSVLRFHETESALQLTAELSSAEEPNESYSLYRTHGRVAAMFPATGEAARRAGGGVRARMAAWRLHAYGGTGELRLEAARVPPLRAPDELLVRVRAAGLNPLDVAMTRGYGARALDALRSLDPLAGGGGGPHLPLICGREFLGTVERAGPATRLGRGARVWGVVPPHRAGAHAQYVLVRDAWAGAAPAALSDEACGGAPYAALTASAALRAAGAVRRALVLGLGGVGQAVVQLLAARGAHVTVGCAGEQVPLAVELGAARALDRHAPDYDRQLEEGGPYCAVVECAGLGGEHAGARRWRFARYVTLTSPLLRETDERGLVAGAAAAGATLLAQSWRAAAAAAQGGGAGACPPHVRWAYFAPRAQDLEEVRRLAERGRYRVVVERVFPWWAGGAAYERAGAGGARGKLVLDWTPAPPADVVAPDLP